MALSTTDKQWIAWSGQNPYYGVLGFETSGMSEAEQLAAFLETGRRDIGRVIDLIEKHFGGFERREAALDFGCGVGRLVKPLAERFERVTGVDIAPRMLDIARQNTGASDRVDLILSDRMMNEPIGPFDFVHTFIVLQHIRPEQGMGIIGRLVDLVRPGGFFALHFTIGDLNRQRRMLNMVRYRVPPIHWAYNLSKGRPWNEPKTEMNRYEAGEVLALVRSKGCPYVLAVPHDHDGHAGVMMIGKIEDKTP